MASSFLNLLKIIKKIRYLIKEKLNKLLTTKNRLSETPMLLDFI